MFDKKFPEPTPLIRPMPKATELPLCDLGPLIEPIKAIATITQAPEALALQGVLNAISIAAQSRANVETLLDTRPLSLFLFSVAASSERKSSVNGLAMKAIRDFEKPLLADHKRRLDLFNEAEKSNGPRRADCLIEESYGSNSDVPATRPISPKILFDDVTYEGIVLNLEFGQPSIGLCSDEGGKILGGHSFNAQNQLAFAAAFSNLWDGKGINKVRAGSGSIDLPGRRMALHLSVQPRVAHNLFADEEIRDQGFLSRILVVMPESLKGTRFLREDEESLEVRQTALAGLEWFNTRITALLARTPKTAEGNPQELALPTLELEAAARGRLRDFYNIVERQQADDGLYANIAGFAGKAAEQAARIAGIIAIFRDPDVQAVSVEDMSVAITLMQFYLDEAVRIFDTGNVSQKYLDAELLRVWLCQRYDEDHVDLSEIVKCGPGRLRSSALIKELMRVLEEYGHLEKAEGLRVEIRGRTSRKAFRIIRT